MTTTTVTVIHSTSGLDVVTAAATVAAAVGTIGAVLVALYLSVWRERRRKPSLTLSIEDSAPETSYGLVWEDPARFRDPEIPVAEPVYVEVTNANGHSTAHDVEVLLSVDYTNRAGETYTEFEHRPLTWAFVSTPEGLPLTSVSIPAGVTRKAVLLRYGPWTWVDAFLTRMSLLYNVRPDPDPIQVNALFSVAPITWEDYQEIADWMSYSLRFLISGRDFDAVEYEVELKPTVDKQEDQAHPSLVVSFALDEFRRV